MKAKSMVLMLIALGCGLVASIGISQVMDRGNKDAPQQMEMENIYVALSPIDIGERFGAENVKLEPWPKDRVPEGAVKTKEELEERFAKTRLYPGEAILAAKLMDSNESTAGKIPEGYRAVSIKVSLASSVSNLLMPGDRVDIVVYLRRSGEILKTSTRTILRDVRVFAVNAEVDREIDRENGATAAKTVSVLVKPSQVETLMLADELGELRLTLRRPGDLVDEQTGGATVDKLIGKEGEVADDRDAEGEGDSFRDWLVGVSKKEESGTPTPAEPAAPVYQWSMIMHTPEGVQKFNWTDPNELPESVLVSGAPAQAPALPSLPSGNGKQGEESVLELPPGVKLPAGVELPPNLDFPAEGDESPVELPPIERES